MTQQLSKEQIQRIMRDVEGELAIASEAEYRIATRSEESFVRWLLTAVKRVAHAVASVLAAPLKFAAEVIAGFFRFLFG